MENLSVIGLAGSLIASIFFSGIEVAFLSFNKQQVDARAQKPSLPGRIMNFFMSKPTWFIGTTLIGNIASLVLFGIFVTRAVLPWIESRFPSSAVSAIIAIVLMTFILS